MCGPCHDAREERGEAAHDHRVGILSGPRTGPSRSPSARTAKPSPSDLNGVFHVWTLRMRPHGV